MRVLITGGGGFIGSHLVDRHLARGDAVVVVDDFSTGSPANLAHHLTDRLTVLEGRAEDPHVIERAFRDVDLVYHLAAAVGVFEVLRRPLEALRTNLDASESVFQQATAGRIRTVFTSTSEVYGKNDRDGLTERDDSIFGPTSLSRWLYAVSKAADEFMAFAYHREHGLPVTIVRLFNTTGPRQTGSYGMVTPRFVRQALRGEPLTVFGDGRQTRCFTNVHDVAQSLMRLAETPGAIGKVVNVGQPEEISILDLARLVIRETASSSQIRFVAYDEAYGRGFEDMRRRIPDVSLLRELIGAVPGTRIEETIAQIVAWERSPAGRTAAAGAGQADSTEPVSAGTIPAKTTS